MSRVSEECRHEGVIVSPEVALACHADHDDDPLLIQKQNLTTFLLYESLSETTPPGDTGDKDAALQSIEARLDLLIQLVSQLLSQQRPGLAPQTVQLSASAIEWRSAEPPPARGWLEIFLEPGLPRSIRLAVENTPCTSPGDSARVCSRFASLDSPLANSLEKWIFRRHRREVAQQRRGGAGD